jgi:hypothetical protein
MILCVLAGDSGFAERAVILTQLERSWMDQIEKLAATFAATKKKRQDLESEEKDLKNKLSRLLDEDAQPEEDFIMVPMLLCPAEGDVESYFLTRFGEMFEILKMEKSADEHWIVEYRKRPQYVEAHHLAGEYEVARKSYTQGDDIDLEVLAILLDDPDAFGNLISYETEIVLNPDAVKKWIDEDPSAFALLNLAAKAGQPRTRIDVKKVEK